MLCTAASVLLNQQVTPVDPNKIGFVEAEFYWKLPHLRLVNQSTVVWLYQDMFLDGFKYIIDTYIGILYALKTDESTRCN